MSAANRKPAVRFIFLTLLLDVIGFGLLIPVSPRLVELLLGAGESESAPIYSLLAATYALVQFFFAPVLGALSDRFGRRPVILISLFGSGLDYFAGALAPSMSILFITRAVNGLTGANMSACNAYIADITPPEKRAGAYGLIGAAFGIGFIAGPALGGLLGEWDIRAPFWAAGACCMLNWLYGYFVLPESLPQGRRRPFDWRRAHPVGTFTHLARYPAVIGLASSLFLLNLAMFGLHATWVLYTKYRYGWSALDVGLSLTAVGIGAAVVQGGLARKIIPRLGEPRSLLIGIAIGVGAYFAYGFATAGWMVYVIVTVASLGGIAQPAGMSIITKCVPANEQGEVQGALTSLNSIAAIFGPIIGGAVFGYFISERAPVLIPGASYFVSGILAAGGLGLAVLAMQRAPAALVDGAQTPGGEQPPDGELRRPKP